MNINTAAWFINSGWYFGQWSDMDFCLKDATYSQYVLTTIYGRFTGNFTFTRATLGKYMKGFSTQIGLCLPMQCKINEIADIFDDFIKSHAQNLGWQDVQIFYSDVSNY